jgi:NAD(P)-dependent dehydrogenase (short-subunit alcohol dehydrogenase family)
VVGLTVVKLNFEFFDPELMMFQPSLLKGKRILVTGGGTGLGREMADEYAKLGAEIYICGRRGPVVEETAMEIAKARDVRVTALECDIRVPDAVDDMMTRIFNEGPLDGLVNNAAGNFISRTKDLSPNAFNAIVNIVFHGTFYVTLAAGKRWIAAKHKANVISILTTWIWNGGPFTVPSAMSKAGLNIMTKSLAVEWAPHGIRLNAIAPGPFPTKGAWERLNPGGARSQTLGSAEETSVQSNPMGRVGEMQELRNLAVFLMADGIGYLTGETIVIDGGAHLGGSGNFSGLSKLGDAEWDNIRAMIKTANDQDKAKRTV